MTIRNPAFPLSIPVLALSLILFCQGALARDYQVEVVVFERTGSTDVENEVWDFSPENLAQHQSRMVNLSTKATEDFEFDPALTHLAGVQRNLVDSGLRILRTANWIQPSAVYQNAPLVSLGIENSTMPYGFIRVYRTSLIFVDVDLQISPLDGQAASVLAGATIGTTVGTGVDPSSNITDQANAASSLAAREEIPDNPHYFISEKRRVKFKEIHYFDHPRFGVIVSVWPSESEQ
jgi:hypothetical protein